MQRKLTLTQRSASFALKLSQRARKQLRRGQVSMIWKKSKSRLIPELEELMTCSCQSENKFDQSSLQVVMKLEDRYLSRGGALFPRVPLPITSRKASKRYER